MRACPASSGTGRGRAGHPSWSTRPPLLASTIRDRVTLGHLGGRSATVDASQGRNAWPIGGVRARPEFWPVALLSVALVAVLGGWGAPPISNAPGSDPACAERTTLRVAAAPSIAAAGAGGRRSGSPRGTAAWTSSSRPGSRRTCCASCARRRRRSRRPTPGCRSRHSGCGGPAPPARSRCPPRASRSRARRSCWRSTSGPRPGSAGPARARLDAVWSRPNGRRCRWCVPDPATSPLGFGALLGIRALASDRTRRARRGGHHAPARAAHGRDGRRGAAAADRPGRRREPRSSAPSRRSCAAVTASGRGLSAAARARPRLPVRRALLQPVRAGHGRVPAPAARRTRG